MCFSVHIFTESVNEIVEKSVWTRYGIDICKYTKLVYYGYKEIRTMKNKKYQFEQLAILFKENIRPYLVETAEDVPFHEVRKVIEEAVLGEKIKQLQATYDDENYSMDIWAEGFRSTILIQDELHGISYDFLNEKYIDNDKWVEIAGFNTPQNSICEDTNILLDIIITFLETGRPCKRYKWIKTKEE